MDGFGLAPRGRTLGGDDGTKTGDTWDRPPRVREDFKMEEQNNNPTATNEIKTQTASHVETPKMEMMVKRPLPQTPPPPITASGEKTGTTKLSVLHVKSDADENTQEYYGYNIRSERRHPPLTNMTTPPVAASNAFFPDASGAKTPPIGIPPMPTRNCPTVADEDFQPNWPKNRHLLDVPPHTQKKGRKKPTTKGRQITEITVMERRNKRRRIPPNAKMQNKRPLRTCIALAAPNVHQPTETDNDTDS